MTKQELSERIAELYGVEIYGYVAITRHAPPRSKRADVVKPVKTLLLDDTERMFKLAVEHGFCIEQSHDEMAIIVFSVRHLNKFTSVNVLYHPTKLEATLWAIGLALVEKAESK